MAHQVLSVLAEQTSLFLTRQANTILHPQLEAQGAAAGYALFPQLALGSYRGMSPCLLPPEIGTLI